MTISPAATSVLTRAAERPDHRLEFHRKLPTGGRHNMIDALLRDGLIAETQGDYRLSDGSALIEDATTGLMLTTLRITDAGLAAVGRKATQEPNAAPQAATDTAAAPLAPSVALGSHAAALGHTAGMSARPTLRHAVQAVLAVWDDEANHQTGITAALEGPMTALRGLLVDRTPRATTGTPRTPRAGTKQEAVLALQGVLLLLGAEVARPMSRQNMTLPMVRAMRQQGWRPIIVGTWQAARADAPDLTEDKVREALEQFEPMWDELFPGEQARIVQALVERVTVGLTGADIRLRVEGLAGLVRDLRPAAGLRDAA